jgi:hypothetical protein
MGSKYFVFEYVYDNVFKVLNCLIVVIYAICCSSRANGGYSGTAYDRWVEQRGNESTNKSTITKMQHHYWVTKQTVFRKLGKKEDDCVVASDAELDAKLELFRSVQDSCLDLQRIIDKYQERLCSKNSYTFYHTSDMSITESSQILHTMNLSVQLCQQPYNA